MTLVNDPEEILDLVDEKDRVIGKLARRDVPKLEAGIIKGVYRAVDGFIVNKQGQLWIPRRTTNRKIAPGGLDVGVGEHVQSGETYLEALIRGFQEEARMPISPEDLEYIGKIDLRSVPLPIFEEVYLLRQNSAPDYNPDDFSGYEWLRPQEILDRIHNGETVKKNLKMAIELIIESSKVKK